MKMKFTNFGYHQLIEKRGIPLDRHIRKPRVLSVLEVIYFFASIGFAIASYAGFSEGFLWYFGGFGLVCVLFCLAAFFLATESKHFLPLSLLASVLLIIVCYFIWFSFTQAPVAAITCLVLLPVVNIGILLLNNRVRTYFRWVVSNG